MKKILTFILGIVLGFFSWGIAYQISGTFEPFDSDSGFYISQIILVTSTFVVSFRNGIINFLILIIGQYIGLNAYPYLLGNSEHRAYAILGAITTIALIIFPLFAGFLARIANFVLSKVRQHNLKTD